MNYNTGTTKRNDGRKWRIGRPCRPLPCEIRRVPGRLAGAVCAHDSGPFEGV